MHSELPFLFIHGAGGTQSKWRLVRQLLTEVEGWYINLPGHGANTGAPKGSVEEYAEQLNTAIQQDFIVVGHSMGGLIGIELAAKSQYAKALVLIASHYSLPVHEKILSKLSEGIFPESLFYASYGKNARRELLEEEKTETSWVSTETTFSDYNCCNRYDNGEQVLSKLNIPVFALYGADDRLLPPMAKDNLMKVNSRVRVETVKGSGHYVMLEQPDEVVQILRRARTSVHRDR